VPEHEDRGVETPQRSMGDLRDVGARRATIDVSVQLVARVLNLALGVVVTLVLVRALGSRGFGAWSSIFAIGQIAGSFGDLGLNQIAVNRAAASPAREPRWLGALVSLRLVLAVPITLISAVAILLIAPGHEAKVAGILLTLLTIIGVPTCLTVVFQLRVRNDIPMGIMTVNSLMWTGAALLVAGTSSTLLAFSGAFFVTSAITSMLTVAVALRLARVQLRGARTLWRPLLRVGIGLGIAGVLVTSYVRLDQILVLEFAGSREAGLYGAAYRLLDQIQFIPMSVMTTLFPLIAAAHAVNVSRARELLQTAGEYLAMASLPILAFTIVASADIVAFLFGAQFRDAAPAVPILAGAFVSISFGYLAGNMVVVLELQRRFARYAGIALVLNAALNVVLIPEFGFIAAAWITLLTEVTVMSLSMRAVFQGLSMTPRIDRLLRTALAAALMGLVSWVAQGLGAPLGVLVVVALLTYVPFLVALRVLRPGEVMAILRKDVSAIGR
jgi:O-antigen/teichoic acid export membrane protein